LKTTKNEKCISALHESPFGRRSQKVIKTCILLFPRQPNAKQHTKNNKNKELNNEKRRKYV
jgi:hypothetical protein